MEPPAGAAPARLSYKGSLQAATRRLNGRSLQCCPGQSGLMKPALALARLRGIGAPTRNGLPKSCKLGAPNETFAARIAMHQVNSLTERRHR